MIHSVLPSFGGREGVLLATGIRGATVMPHVIFLHSALTQNRIVVRDPARLRRLFHFEIIDVTIAMGLAGMVNAAMLIMAASTFNKGGFTEVATIEEAYRTLEPLLGSAAGWVFAISLLASGLSSASVGTMAGQVIMQGFVHRQIPIWIRRLITMLPVGGCNRNRTRSHPHAGAEPGSAQFWTPLRFDSAGHVYPASRLDEEPC